MKKLPGSDQEEISVELQKSEEVGGGRVAVESSRLLRTCKSVKFNTKKPVNQMAFSHESRKFPKKFRQTPNNLFDTIKVKSIRFSDPKKTLIPFQLPFQAELQVERRVAT